jgi:hypothetical protein
MSLTAILIAGAVVASQPAPALDAKAELVEIDVERSPMRCRPAPYYVADRGDRPRIERQMITGSRVASTARDYAERRPRPCFLMRDEMRDNPLRTAD